MGRKIDKNEILKELNVINFSHEKYHKHRQIQRYFAAFCQILDENFGLFAIIDYLKCLVDAPVTVKIFHVFAA